MDFSAIKDLYIGSTPVQSAWLNGSKVWGRKPAVDEQSIRDAMILWYDLEKQGATNEGMAADPRIIDHSGNGHHATCYNFAWSGMSGIGGYDAKLFTESIEGNAGYVQLIDSYTIHISKITNSNTTKNGSYWDIGKLAFRVILNVSGLQEGQDLFICQYNNDWYGRVQLFEGRNDVTLDFTGTDVNGNLKYWYATFYTTTPGDFDVTIKLEPLYPNALVFDGVDDKCNSISFQMDNFAVFVDLDFISNEQNYSTGVYKLNNFNIYYRKNNVLNIFLNNNNNTNILQRNDILHLNSQGLVVFKDGTTYNIPTENYEGHNKTPISLNGANGSYIQLAFRRMLLFNRVLTLEEIEWVRTNLITE